MRIFKIYVLKGTIQETIQQSQTPPQMQDAIEPLPERCSNAAGAGVGVELPARFEHLLLAAEVAVSELVEAADAASYIATVVAVVVAVAAAVVGCTTTFVVPVAVAAAGIGGTVVVGAEGVPADAGGEQMAFVEPFERLVAGGASPHPFGS